MRLVLIAHCDKRHSQGTLICHLLLKSILQLPGLSKNWFQMIPDIIRCHGSMYIHFMESWLDLSR